MTTKLHLQDEDGNTLRTVTALNDAVVIVRDVDRIEVSKQ